MIFNYLTNAIWLMRSYNFTMKRESIIYVITQNVFLVANLKISMALYPAVALMLCFLRLLSGSRKRDAVHRKMEKTITVFLNKSATWRFMVRRLHQVLKAFLLAR